MHGYYISNCIAAIFPCMRSSEVNLAKILTFGVQRIPKLHDSLISYWQMIVAEERRTIVYGVCDHWQNCHTSMEGLILMQYKSSSKFIFIELYNISLKKEEKRKKTNMGKVLEDIGKVGERKCGQIILYFIVYLNEIINNKNKTPNNVYRFLEISANLYS